MLEIGADTNINMSVRSNPWTSNKDSETLQCSRLELQGARCIERVPDLLQSVESPEKLLARVAVPFIGHGLVVFDIFSGRHLNPQEGICAP